ncbi:hypothetical protein EUTSA_v10009556mg [Eutrema salsugineum]|uniref:F-box domain-containing protein n=1 Tax=Eutrema salsugineum TaxID=72664 RepID=V4L262_EUTSA|nr:hypothetical protein EUTSA_v10009556mg [Eutrema salsugineum]
MASSLKRDGNVNEEDKKDRSPIEVDPIPHDLELEIMTRLPGKYLMRFLRLSKMWSSIIRSQRFVDSYYAMSSATRSRFTISFSNGPNICETLLFIFSSSYEKEESSSLATNLEMVIPSLHGFSDGSDCYSVNGLIGCSGLFTVCNPSTKKVTTFPYLGPFTLFFLFDKYLKFI